jgi:hypothetical protein
VRQREVAKIDELELGVVALGGVLIHPVGDLLADTVGAGSGTSSRRCR